eukprot:CAMPEP_0176309540 /NCGR_PEP_ID=MMETSP0121_2-20121125/65132_1 /TAXON_ID=160619 /ORGANISM="Kryptoperidinium foliaceum, Strain CCMP 1326" /LENGTH=223 /DNA_ID=CAMNT_0017651447 /DNA_START=155 /DNA_END=824 /DNA_ORIENTATION=+
MTGTSHRRIHLGVSLRLPRADRGAPAALRVAGCPAMLRDEAFIRAAVGRQQQARQALLFGPSITGCTVLAFAAATVAAASASSSRNGTINASVSSAFFGVSSAAVDGGAADAGDASAEAAASGCPDAGVSQGAAEESAWGSAAASATGDPASASLGGADSPAAVGLCSPAADFSSGLVASERIGSATAAGDAFLLPPQPMARGKRSVCRRTDARTDRAHKLRL